MRLWTISPEYLDPKGLVALWRETLLAKKVLEGKTTGYKNHPQLIRFKESKDLIKSINRYLEIIYNESIKREYNFDSSKFAIVDAVDRIEESEGQLQYEWSHFLNKLK